MSVPTSYVVAQFGSLLSQVESLYSTLGASSFPSILETLHKFKRELEKNLNDPFPALPNEVTRQLFSFLPLKAQLQMPQVCKRFRPICGESFWKSSALEECKRVESECNMEKCFENYMRIDTKATWRKLACCLAFGERDEGIFQIDIGTFERNKGDVDDLLLNGWGLSFRSGKLDGYSDMSVGQFEHGELDGKGSTWSSTSEKTEFGDFEQDKLISGYKAFASEHLSYSGEFNENEVYRGKMVWENGLVYEGEWMDELPTGLKSL
jgi:hypothetical protein